MAGMAYVDVVFASSAQLDRGRKAVADQVARLRARLPTNDQDASQAPEGSLQGGSLHPL